MSYDQNSSGNNGGTPSPPPPTTPPPLSWYASISSMALGALGRGSGRGAHPLPADRSNTNTNTNIISHSDRLTLLSENEAGASLLSFAAGRAAASANSTSTSTTGRTRSIPISFLINHTPEPHPFPRIPENPSFSTSSSPLSSLSSPSISSAADADEWALSSSTASSESPSLAPAQIRRSPRSRSAAALPLGGAPMPTTQATMAGASASYYRAGVRGSVLRLSQSYHHFAPQSVQGRRGNSSSALDSGSSSSISSNHNNNINDNGSGSSSALPSLSTQVINAEPIDAPVFSTTHLAQSRRSRALSHPSLSRNDNNVQNSFYDSRLNAGRSTNNDSDNNSNGDNSTNNNNSNNNNLALILSPPRSSGQAENQKRLLNAAQRNTSVSSPFEEEDRPLGGCRVLRSPSTAPSVKARALFSSGKGAFSDSDCSHRAIKTEQESIPPLVLSPEVTESGASTYSAAASTAENSSPAGGSKARPKPKRTKTGKILQKHQKVTASNRRTAYTRFLKQQSRDLAERMPHLSAQDRMKIIVENWKVSDKNSHTTRRRRVDPAQPSRTGNQSTASASTSISTATASSESGTDPNQGSTYILTHKHAPSMLPSMTRSRLLRSTRRNNPTHAPNSRPDQKEEIPEPQQKSPDDDHRDVEE